MQLHASPQDGATAASRGHLPRDLRDGAQDARLCGGEMGVRTGRRKGGERERAGSASGASALGNKGVPVMRGPLF